jgi:uncharacterized RDD family membrane protein YckC
VTEQKINAGNRFASMILDHFIMTSAAMIFAIPGMVSGFVSAFKISHEQTNPDLFGNMSYVMIIGFAIYLCKDSINGRSPAKRILKLQVVDNNTGKAASPIKCFVRNIFCIVWPIEVIIALANPPRRIGDFVAGTKVAPFDPMLAPEKPKWAQAVISLALAYGLLLMFMIPFNMMMAGLTRHQVKYIETSYNENLSKETEKLFEGKLGYFMTPDVRVYDKVENSDLKYVSVILRLKENNLEHEDSYEKLKSITIPLLLTKFPENTFTGRMQYIYQSGGSVQSRSLSIGKGTSEK